MTRSMGLFLIIIAISKPCQVVGQSASIFCLGIKTGTNWSRFVEDGVENDFYRSYLLGLSVEYRFTSRISFAADALYSKQGNRIHFSNPGLFTELRTKHDFLVLPLNLRYRLRRYPILLVPGIQMGLLIDRQVDFLPKSGYTNSNFASQKKIDLGYTLGIGYRFGEHILVEGRYYRGTRTILKGYNGLDPATGLAIYVPSVSQHNQVFSVGLTYYPFIRKM